MRARYIGGLAIYQYILSTVRGRSSTEFVRSQYLSFTTSAVCQMPTALNCSTVVGYSAAAKVRSLVRVTRCSF